VRVAIVSAGAVVVGVALLFGALFVFQDRLVYLPDASGVGRAADAVAGARDVSLETQDGLRLGAWFVPAAPGSDLRMAVLVAHGNGGNRADRAPLAAALARAGLSVLLFDYRGYGGNPGTPSEEGLARDARAAVAALAAQPGVRPDRILYFGESLGAAVVTRLATERPPAGLLLRSPFADLASVGERRYPFLPVRLLLRDRYPVAEQIARVPAPATVVYGTHDSLVPPDQSRRVAAAAEFPARMVAVDGADHNDRVFLDGSPLIRATADLARRSG
jgi:uncharacterized protein